MNSLDKLFKIGLLVLGFGFLGAYAYSHVRPAPAPNPSSNVRYVMNVGNYLNGHVVYLVDTQTGTVFYAEKTGVNMREESLTWRASQPVGGK